MQFTSISFLFHFLPIFLILYYIADVRFKNTILLLGSVVYYGLAVEWATMPMVVLLIITLLTYVAGLAIERKPLRWLFPLMLVTLACVMIFFKCVDGGKLFPVGMSFYLFQVTAYLVCIYQGKLEAEKNIISYGAQVMMFPKVTSGPLCDPVSLQQQTRSRTVTAKDFHRGLQLLILGMSMKVLIANRVGSLWNQAAVIGYDSLSTPFAWLSLTGYAMKLYLDFFGYSVMAMGLGRMMGFHLPKNFDDPYTAKSNSDFYRRWHASLGLWFRNNIYIPMGGNRKGELRTILNLLVVWTFTGLWHGVGGNYLLWAGILAFFIILERLFLRKFLDKSRVLSHVYTVLIIMISWVPFAIGDWNLMLIFLGRMFGIGGAAGMTGDFTYWLKDYAELLIPGILIMTGIPGKLWYWIEDSWLADVICFVLFWFCVYFIATAAQDPFAYF
jgi:alginate O-acetyltransferase complex protein AlgI